MIHSSYSTIEMEMHLFSNIEQFYAHPHQLTLDQIFYKYEFEVHGIISCPWFSHASRPPKHRVIYLRALLLFRLPAGPIYPRSPLWAPGQGRNRV